MRDHEDALQSRSGCDDVPGSCRNCGHHEDYHFASSGPPMICGHIDEGAEGCCGCERFDPLSAEDILSDCNPEGI
jgi:hypothetical protein